MDKEGDSNNKQPEVQQEESEVKQETAEQATVLEPKDPETLSEGERMGLSKQQLRKLEKKLAA